ncbi:MAG: sigma-54 dependent transcriptional regulator [Thermodesulfobacteriota bacterium]
MTELKSKHRLLLVDDDQTFLRLFLQLAKIEGRDKEFDIITAGSGEEALDRLQKAVPDVVVTDVQMSGLDGLDLVHRINDHYPGLPVIMLTAYGGVTKAVEAIKMGAYHYFLKPVNDPELFWKTIREAADKKRTADELESYRRDHDRNKYEAHLVGESRAWHDIVETIHRVAPLPSTVLITGETGTGKELVARAVHRLSPLADRPFLAVSCVEFAGSLLETELFGHERGAFTGALTRRRGIFERANGGTLFLDEIAETSPEMQAKLLRVLEGYPFHRVGGQEPLRSDFRLVAATNRDLNQEVAAGRFRQDLYYRLAVYPINLPPLRDRREDILPLSLHLIERTARRLGRPGKKLSGAALTLLMHHDWPGNVRELANLMERALITSQGEEILPEDLFAGLPSSVHGLSGVSLEDMEKMLIRLALERTANNKSLAAEALGIARKTLSDKMARHGLKDKPPV